MPTGISIHVGLNELDEAHYRGRFALSGCLGDAHAMRDLAAAAGFEPELITGADATAQAVVDAIARARPRVGPDGMLLLTYSGHGSRVRDLRDDPGDGDRHDEWDETWCLYDRQLVDDELYACWAAFPPGARILVVSDSCLSGGMLRGDDRPGALRRPARALWGTHPVPETLATEEGGEMAPAAVTRRARGVSRGGGSRRRALAAQVARRVYFRNQALYDGLEPAVRTGPLPPIEAELVLLSAAQDNEPAADGERHGAFTQALLEVWNGGAFQGDYVALHAELRRRLAPGQHPLLQILRPPSFVHQRPFTI